MPAVVRKGDTCTGHGGYGPRPNDEGSPNVFVNGIPVHREGDHWKKHEHHDHEHDSHMGPGSGTVFVNGKSVARIGDDIDCGSACAVGSGDVFAG